MNEIGIPIILESSVVQIESSLLAAVFLCVFPMSEYLFNLISCFIIISLFLQSDICEGDVFWCDVGAGCVHKSAVCDGIPNCLDASDEWIAVGIDQFSKKYLALMLRGAYKKHNLHLSRYINIFSG